MGRLILLLCLCVGLYAGEAKIVLKEKSKEETLIALIDKLATPFNLNKTLKAIVAVESDYGKYKINIFDKPYGSCGVTHINLKSYMTRHNIPVTKFNINKACQELIDNDELAIANAIEELVFWQEQICKKSCTTKQWIYVWSAYNAGYNYKGKAGLEYANKVKSKLQ